MTPFQNNNNLKHYTNPQSRFIIINNKDQS